MRHSEAKEIVHDLMLITQKARSNIQEAMCGHSEPSEVELWILSQTNPWLFGEKCVLPALAKMDARDITPGEFHNIIWIAHRDPAILLMWQMWHNLKELVEPQLSWMKGWDPE